MKTLLIGLDAASPAVVERLFDVSDLPHLRSIFEEGVNGVLESQIPPWTGSAWPSLYTGTNPGKHGVFGFLTFDGYEWDVINATDVREYTLWELLARHGQSSVVVNVPVTHPPRSFDGALVPGYAAPENPECHPPEMLDDIRQHVGDYRVYPPHEGGSEEISLAQKIDEYQTLVRMRGDAFRYLVDRFEPQFGFLQFQVTDTVFHECPGEFNAVQRVYESVDEQLGTILETCTLDNILVVSDHGIGEYTGYQFHVNEFLRRRGMLTSMQGGSGMPDWTTIRDGRLRGETSTPDIAHRTFRATITAMARTGLTTARIKALLETINLDNLVGRYVGEDIIRAGTEQVDFPNSQAYVRDAVELGVRINLEGRDLGGTVPPEDYEAVRTSLIESLANVQTPDGEAVFEEVAPRDEFFHGPEVDRAVDIVTVPRQFEHALSTRLTDDLFLEPSEPWNHKRDGVIAAMGEAIDPKVPLGDAGLLDVAPTVLASLGVPWGDHMDGAPLPIVPATSEYSYPSFEPGTRIATNDQTVEQRLSDHGYLE